VHRRAAEIPADLPRERLACGSRERGAAALFSPAYWRTPPQPSVRTQSVRLAT
jgi:hypothetical protein